MNTHSSLSLKVFLALVLLFISNCYDVNEFAPDDENEEVEIEFVTDDEKDANEIEIVTPLEKESDNCQCGIESTLKAPSVNDRRRRKRIVSDTATWPFHRYPWIAQIRVEDQQICGAALINPNYLITASHCAMQLSDTDDRKSSKVISTKEAFVALGSQIKDQQFVTYKIIKVVMHPLFKMVEDRPIYDIALLKIQNPVMFSSRIRPICLPASRRVEIVGTMALAVGWGGSAEGAPPSEVLKEVFLPIVSEEECAKGIRKEYVDRLGPFTICAGGSGGKDTCQGDSGGPLIVLDSTGKWTLVGITSWGDEFQCAREGKAGVYARVSYFRDWIINETQDSVSCKEMDYTRLEPNLIECGLPTLRFELSGVNKPIDEKKEPETELPFPWMVKILYDGELLGSGVLVNRSTILTTTDVIDPWDVSYRSKKLEVEFGDTIPFKARSSSFRLKAEVKHVMFHPLADYRFSLCLLRLKLKLADITLPYPPVCFSHLKFANFHDDDIELAVFTKRNYSAPTLEIFSGVLLPSMSCEEESFRHPNYRIVCVNIERTRHQSCTMFKGMALMQLVGDRRYLLGLASNIKNSLCDKIADDVNWIWPWISQTVTLLNMS